MSQIQFRTALLLASLTAGAGAATQGEIRLEKDLVYAERDGVKLLLDLARPARDAELHPGLIFIHGGGWRHGSRAAGSAFVRQAAARGYVAATIDYRLAPEHLWPAAWEDTRAALAWLRANAPRWHLDPERIGAVGASAGGHLALLLGSVDGPDRDRRERVQAVVNFFGPSDLTRTDIPPRAVQILRTFFGAALEEKRAAYEAASPIRHLSPGDAPVLSFHGSADPLVPPNQSKLLHAALSKLGVPERLELIEGAGHGWGGKTLARTFEQALAFFDRYLRGSDLPLALVEDFEDGLAHWCPTDPRSWKIAGQPGARYYSLFRKQGSYKPPVRSPINIAIREGFQVGAMCLDLRLRTTHAAYAHRDLCVLFGYRDPAHFYYVHLGQKADPHSNSIFLVNGEARVSIAKKRTAGTPWQARWHRLRITRDPASGSIEVFFDDFSRPVMSATDRTFERGRIGLGSFDDTGDFDVLRVRGS